MKKPAFKSFVHHEMIWNHLGKRYEKYKVRVTDAREMTPEQAVRKVLECFRERHCSEPCEWSDRSFYKLAEAAGMTATIKDGRVKVRRAK